MRRLLGWGIVMVVVLLGAAPVARADQGNGNGNGQGQDRAAEVRQNDADHGNANNNGNANPNAAANVANDDHGKPCDGCVGNADGKQPPGQSPGDKNNGFECDANHGVGQGNPAHSPCPVTPAIATTTTTTAKPPVTTTTSTTVATAVLGEHFSATTTTVPTQVLGEHFARGDLANTGGPAWLTAVGLPLVLIGFGLVTLQRRMAQRATA